jgi:predicted phage tail component-like protein
MSTDLTLNGVALSTAVPEALVVVPTRPLVGRRRDVFVDVPGRAGSWAYPEEPGDRVLEFEIHIQADTFDERRTAVEALAAWCDLGEVSPLIVSDRPDRYHDAILDHDADPAEWLTTAKASLRFRCGAYALASAQSTEAISVSGAGSDSGSFNVTDAVEAEPVIEITPTNGTITSFVLIINGAEVAWQDGSAGDPNTIAQDETITISTLSQTVTLAANYDVNLTGAFDPNEIDMAAVAITGFPDLSNGSNSWTLTWTGTATTIDLDIAWRERFL